MAGLSLGSPGRTGNDLLVSGINSVLQCLTYIMHEGESAHFSYTELGLARPQLCIQNPASGLHPSSRVRHPSCGSHQPLHMAEVQSILPFIS